MNNYLKSEDYFAGPTDYTPSERKLPEKKVEKKSKDWAKRNGWHSRKWSSPGHTSVPDQIFWKEGRVVFIEYKRIGNEPTDLQCDEAEFILKHGGEVYWTDTLRGTKQILENIYE